VKVAVLVAGAVPNPAQSGSALTVWTIVRYLVEAGHRATVLVLHEGELDGPGAGAERIERLRGVGAEVRLLESQAGRVFEQMTRDPVARLRRVLRPPDEEMLPHLLDADVVRAAVEDVAPDVLYAYHWEAVGASSGLRGVVPRFATVVDLPQLSAWHRWRVDPKRLRRAGLRRLLWLQGRLRHMPELLVRLLNECEASGNFAAHHAAWLRERGAAGCEYLRTPIEDRSGEGWRAARQQHPPGGRPRFLLIGHLRGVSTLEGLDVVATSILPRLERSLGPDGLELRIAGGYGLPPHLHAALDRPSVRLLGHLEDPDAEFSAADALLVPTSIPLGTRVRILSAWSFGCPVVAHRANASGIPELAHRENALVGTSSEALVAGLLEAVRDRSLAKQLSEGGRASYERWFAPRHAAGAIESTLASLAAAPASLAS